MSPSLISTSSVPVQIVRVDNYIYCISRAGNNLAIIDTTNNTVIRTITGFDGPNSITTNNTRLWIVNAITASPTSYSNNIVTLNSVSGTNIVSLAISDLLALTESSVAVTSIPSYTVITTISSSSSIRGIMYASGYLWVTSTSDRSVYKLNASDGSLVSQISHPLFLGLSSFIVKTIYYIWVFNTTTINNTYKDTTGTTHTLELANHFYIFGIPITNTTVSNILVINNGTGAPLGLYANNNRLIAGANNFNTSTGQTYPFVLVNFYDLSTVSTSTIPISVTTTSTTTRLQSVNNLLGITRNIVSDGTYIWITTITAIYKYELDAETGNPVLLEAIGMPTEYRQLNYSYLFNSTIYSTNFVTGSFGLVVLPVTLYCFNKGTEILCLEDEKEVLIPIESIKEGTLVKTYKHGYKKVIQLYNKKFLNNTSDWKSSMYKMAKKDGMINDLILSGKHSILVDELSEKEVAFLDKNKLDLFKTISIDDKKLVLAASSDEFKVIEDNNEYSVFNFLLENDGNNDTRYGVWANGILCETPSKNFYDKNM